jgi:putative acetyltransferase
MDGLVIAVDDPRADDVQQLLRRHLDFAHDHTPLANVHALDVSGLLDPAVTLFSARDDEQLLAIGALRQLEDQHGEIKSMHTAAEARRRGVGRAMVEHLITVARERGYRRVSLETGTGEAFRPAQALYAAVGFGPCPPFGDYHVTPDNTFLALELD